MPADATFEAREDGGVLRLTPLGRWTAQARGLEPGGRALRARAEAARDAVIDLSRLEALDSAGAWLIGHARADAAPVVNARPDHAMLLREAQRSVEAPPPAPPRAGAMDRLAALGAGVAAGANGGLDALAFLGRVMAAAGGLVARPGRARLTATVHHLDTFALRATPIIALINFLVGGIVAQQGVFQLRRFGAATFAVDLIGILVLRELAVLLTSIMIAGRSGSAITAEIGSMTMREEVDALRVMGLDPIDALVLPRLAALVVGLPLLVIVAEFSALLGGLFVTAAYGGVDAAVFLDRLQAAISVKTFLVGMIKAPFMAILIGLIASREGFAVQGSAESLGRGVTAAVVKSIFMVIVLDGLFAVVFAALNF